MSVTFLPYSLSPQFNQPPPRYLARLVEAGVGVFAAVSLGLQLWGKGNEELAALHLLFFGGFSHGRYTVFLDFGELLTCVSPGGSLPESGDPLLWAWDYVLVLFYT